MLFSACRDGSERLRSLALEAMRVCTAVQSPALSWYPPVQPLHLPFAASCGQPTDRVRLQALNASLDDLGRVDVDSIVEGQD